MFERTGWGSVTINSRLPASAVDEPVAREPFVARRSNPLVFINHAPNRQHKRSGSTHHVFRRLSLSCLRRHGSSFSPVAGGWVPASPPQSEHTSREKRGRGRPAWLGQDRGAGTAFCQARAPALPALGCAWLWRCVLCSAVTLPAPGGLCLQELEENSGWQRGLWLVQPLTPTGTSGLAAIEGVLQTHRLAHRSWRRLPRSTDESGVTSQKTGGRDVNRSCLGGLTCNVGCHEAGHMGCRDGARSRLCQGSAQPRQVLH